MPRLIDADKLVKELNEYFVSQEKVFSDDELFVKGYNSGLQTSIDVVIEAPTVDAVPVKHGHWIKIGSQYSIRNMKCSICGEEVFGDVDTEKYCFNCGAKMDEVTE